MVFMPFNTAPKLLTVCRYKGGVPVDPLSAPGKYKIENKYGVHSLIISRYDTSTVICRVKLRGFYVLGM